MGWNAGGFGSMQFPSAEALAAWRTTTVSHAVYDDWCGELEGGTYLDDEPVNDRVKTLARGHDPKNYSLRLIEVDGLVVSLLYDDGEDGFRELSGDIAATLRCADTHGATGTFHFLGTAGAEEDFAYELAIGKGTSRVTELANAGIRRVYRGAGYAAFTARALELLESGNPALEKMMAKLRGGAKPAVAGASAHETVMAELAKIPDARLAAAARTYPMWIPDGTRGQPAAKMFADAGTVRAKLAMAANEELRGAALWSLGVTNLSAALPIALATLDAKRTSEAGRVAALFVCGMAKQDGAALDRVLATFTRKAATIAELSAASRAVEASAHPELAARATKLLAALGAKPGRQIFGVAPNAHFVNAIGKRHLAGLALPLAAFAIGKSELTGRVAAAEQVLAWPAGKERSAALAKLATARAHPIEIGSLAGKAFLAIEPDAALAEATKLADAKRLDAKQANALCHLLLAATADQAQRVRWIDVALKLLDHAGTQTSYLAHYALTLFNGLAPDPRVVAALEARLAGEGSRALAPYQVVHTLKRQKSKRWRAIAKARLAVTKSSEEKDSLKLALRGLR
jgi:hypothetical protein